MIASLGIGFKVCIQEIGKEEDFKDNKHHEKFDNNNQPSLLPPFWHVGKSLQIKLIYFF